MASAAFLSSTFRPSDQHQPTFFEVIAQQGLANTLHPAAVKLLSSISQFLTEKNYKITARLIDNLQKFQEEILLFVNGLLQFYYLNKYNSSFTEHFYGLERIFQSKTSLLLSWIGLVLVPYLRRKAEKAFLTSRERILDGLEGTKARKTFVKVFPHIHFLCQCLDIGFLLSFTLHKSKYHGILSYLLSFHLHNVSLDKEKEKEIKFEAELKSSAGISGLALNSISYFAKMVTITLETGSFFLQFLDWWYNRSDEHGSQVSMGSNVSIPPPPLPSNIVPGQCPVCRTKISLRSGGATLAPVSGLAFCYPCIVTHVRANNKCPVTGSPLREEDLIRILIEK